MSKVTCGLGHVLSIEYLGRTCPKCGEEAIKENATLRASLAEAREFAKNVLTHARLIEDWPLADLASKALESPSPQATAGKEWWCERCQMVLDGIHVTFDEKHDASNCGEPVQWREKPTPEPREKGGTP